MSTLRYFRWDYNTGIATEYGRRGECNGCGDCCRATIHLVGAKNGHARNGGATTSGEGVWAEVADTYRRFYQVTKIDNTDPHCGGLGPDGKCTAHSQKAELHRICADWPVIPDHLFAKCSYGFVEINQWKFDAK